MSLRVERSETKQLQGLEGYLHSITWFGLFVPTYLDNYLGVFKFYESIAT